MKLDELRELREAAYPGSWEQTPNACHVAAPDKEDDGFWIDIASTETEADARLIALAPDLARLVCELGGALEQIDSDLDLLTGSLPNAMRRTVRTALASLAELGERP